MKTFLTYLLITVGTLASSHFFGQNFVPNYCPSDRITDSLIMHDPRWQRSFFYMEQAIQHANSIPEGERSETVYTLPVVVHVIHKGEPYGQGTNITDEQIMSAITAINNDYRHIAGTNGDGDGPDVGIEFCLASRDPNGNPTTGIVRINGSSVTNYATQGIKASGTAGADELAVKSLSTWPRASYLNIWIVNEIENNDGGSGIQGYAYFPVNNPVDGIVILYNAFGTSGNLKSYTNMNRTFTHEAGHYLGLYHTFYNTSACGAESSCGTQGDKVCDTPVTTLNTQCSLPACGFTQQVENFMDYTSQTCQNRFTEGQKVRMRTTLETQRTSMLSSMGCVPVNTRDAGISAVLSPNGTSCTTTYQPSVTLSNYGSATLTSVTIKYNIDGTGSSSFSWTGNLVSGSSVNVTLPDVTTSLGSHTLYVWTENPNGQSDQNSSNDQSSTTFTVTTGSTLTLDVSLDYFGVENTWQIKDSNGNVIDYGGPYNNNAQGVHVYETICLAEGCYTLIFMDSHGDGQSFISGSFTLTNAANEVLVFKSGNWGSLSTNPFCVTTSAGDPPVASFTISDNIACTNQNVNFTSTSTNSPTSYSWTFQGGTPSTSTQANPQNIKFTNSGVFDITLTATNVSGSNTYICNDCVTVTGGPSLTLTPTHPLCSGETNGSISTNATGSYTPFVYSWTNGATTANISGLAAGIYTLTATNQQGCSSTASSTLTAPSAITATGNVTNLSCNGSSNGSIALTVTGGTGSKTYLWSNNATTSTISNLTGGSYSVTITDANGCTKTQNFTVASPAALAVNGAVIQPSCAAPGGGSIVLTTTGGTGNKTYLWNTGATTSSLSNLSAGSYSVTVTDANGCTKTQSFTLTSPSSISVTGSIVAPGCNTSTDGSITVSASGGTGNKTYLWSTGATTANLSNIGGGVYSVTVSDESGCSNAQSFTVTAPSAMAVTGTVTSPSCSNPTGGSIVASCTGGTGNKTYSWSNGASTSTISNLSDGTYTVTVTDQNGCTGSQSFTITAVSGIDISVSTTEPLCNGSADGSISVSAAGGSGNLSYSWSNGSSSSSISNLAAGNYVVTINDSGGCSATEAITLSQPSALALTAGVIQPSCSAQFSGSIAVSVSGGTGAIAYVWNNGEVTPTISNLADGTYTVTITDSHNCSTFESFTLTAPLGMTVTGTTTHLTCHNSADASITTSVEGGTGTKTFLWSNGATNSTISGLTAGTYTVTVTDEAACTATKTFTINALTPLTVGGVTTNLTCFGSNDGVIVANSAGGVGAKTYLWNNGVAGATNAHLSAGTHSVTVTDSFGCTKSKNFPVIQPADIVITPVITQPTCAGPNTGAISITATGGNGTKTYLWNTGATTSSISNLTDGTYSVTVTDPKGCNKSAVFVLNSPSAMVVTEQISNLTCNGSDDGSIAVNVNGVPGDVTYTWSNGASTSVLNHLAAGNYTLTITDTEGCTKTQLYNVGEPPAVQVNLEVFDMACSAISGSATVNPTGGTSPYTIAWNNGSSGNSVDPLAQGEYSVTITDAHNCIASETFSIVPAPDLSVSIVTDAISCYGGADGGLSVNVTGANGPYTFEWNDGNNSSSRSNLVAGEYSVTVNSSNGCSGSASITLEEPEEISIVFTSSDVLCHGGSTGTATASVSGGEGEVSFEWENGATNDTIENLSTGDYTVTVTDANGCHVESTVTIFQPEILTLAVFKQNVSCYGTDDGTATATATGGTGAFSFLWSTGATTGTIDDLETGEYFVSASDSNGCSVTDTIMIEQPSQMIASTIINSAAGCIGATGSATANIMGGNGPYNFIWNTGHNGQQLNGVFAGEYSVEIYDNSGCKATATAVVPYDCETAIPFTQLIEEDCGTTGLPVNAILTCEEVPSATMYQWRFSTVIGQFINASYSLSPQFLVSQVPALAEGGTFTVVIRAMVNSEWGVYGSSCSFEIEPSSGTTSLVTEDCGSTISGWSESIFATPMTGAIYYEWHFTADDYEWTSYTPTNQFVLESTMLFEPGKTYNVEVRCAMGPGQFTDWGAICEITFLETVGITENTSGNAGLVLYPNPNDGHSIVFEFESLPAGHTIQSLQVFGAQGGLVENIAVNRIPGSTRLTHNFENKLASGMYVIRYSIGGTTKEEKLIVR